MRNRYPSTNGPLLLSLTLLLLGLAACSTNSLTTTGHNASETTVPPTTRNTPVTQTLTRNCGAFQSSILMGLAPTDQGLAQRSEDCFWQAYQRCHPATLTYSQVATDTVEIRTFALQNQDATCVITDTRQFVIVSGTDTPQPEGSAICAGLTRQADGLHFLACGRDGPVLVVPARSSQ